MRSAVKTILWGAFVLLALLWTGGIAIAIEILEWSAEVIASGGLSGLTDAAASVPIPGWLAPFVDLAGWRDLLSSAAAWLSSLSAALPSPSQSLSWLVPLIWVVWGLGTLALLVLTLVASRFLKF